MTTLLWGQLGLLQAWLLPGLTVTWRRRELAIVDRLLLAFPVSAVINFLLIELLTVVGAYNRPAMLFVIVAELGAIGWATRGEILSGSVVADRVVRPPVIAPRPWLDVVFGGSFIVVGLAALQGAFAQLGYIFIQWDAVMSWNRWAVDFAQGRFPQHTWHYPQLVPALISIPYVMAGDPRLQQLGKLVTLALPLLMVATGFRLATYTGLWRHLFAFAAAFATWHFVSLIGSRQPYDGMADVPVAYMVLAAGYGFILAYHAGSATSSRVLALLASFVLAGAMLTKQAGMLALAMPFAWSLYMRERGTPVDRRLLVLSYAILAVVGGHWYGIIEARIRLGTAESEVAYVTSIVQESWPTKLVRGWRMLWPGGSAMLALAAAIATVAAGTHRIGRRILLYGLLPAFLVWSLGFAYDTRNFAVGVIPLACCLVFGGSQLIRWAGLARQWLSGRPRLRAAAVAVGVLVVIGGEIVAGQHYTGARLLDRAMEQKRKKLGEPALNEFLYATLPALPPGESVGTGYQILSQLPGLESRYKLVNCSTEAELRDDLARQHPQYYLWLPERCSDSVNARLKTALADRTVTSLGQHNTTVLLRIDSEDRLLTLLRL